MNKKPIPPGWSEDSITKYIDACRNNQFATFANKRSQVIDLINIDDMFRKLVDGAINPKPYLPMTFLHRAHSAFLTAVGAVMSGQLHEAQSLLRVCLEQAGYGHFIGNDEERWNRWMKRHELRTSTQQDKWRKEFSNGRVIRDLTTADEALGGIYKELYDRTIDYGGHPNERGMSMNSRVVDIAEGGKKFEALYLQGDGVMLDLSLKMTAQTGLCVLRIAQIIYPTRVQAVGIQQQLNDVSKRY